MSKLEKVVLHQTLHGYSNGHRVLSGSKNLEGRDAKTLLIMSDVSGPGAQLPADGYITGYPLLESGYFAFARTWPAPEMPRPGCVWTHTLLVEFSDLASIADLRSLNSLFRRPTLDHFTSYSQPIDLAVSEPGIPPSLNTLWASSLLGGLYGLPAKKIVVQPPSSGSLDGLVLSIWNQQWPKLRRAFRFCTFAASDRVVDGMQFDLQLLPPEGRNLQSRFAGAALVPLEQPQLNQDWIRIALENLEAKNEPEFRRFLRQTGSDYENGRSAFAPLCELYGGLQRNDLGLVKLLLLGPLEGARSTLIYAISRLTDHLADFDGELIELILNNLNVLSKGGTDEIAPHLGNWLWTKRSGSAIALLEKSETVEGRAVMRSLIESDLATVLSWIKNQPSNLGAILPLRPDLLTTTGIWEISNDACEAAMRYVAATADSERNALTSAIASDGERLPKIALRHIGARRMLTALLAVAENYRDRTMALGEWFRQCATPTDLRAVLSSEAHWSVGALSILARHVSPRTVPNDWGKDPWLIAVLNSDDTTKEDDYLDAFLLARALDYRSANAEELIVRCFERVVKRAYAGQLGNESWLLLEDRARQPWSTSTKLGVGDRIALAVVDSFIDRRFSPHAFNELTSDEDLFNHLLDLARLRHSSRWLLVQLESMLSGQGIALVTTRLRRIRAILDY